MRYLPGQRWRYQNREQDAGSLLTILRVEELQGLGHVAFISVQDIRVRDADAPGGLRTEIAFTELTLAALDQSVTSLVDQVAVPSHDQRYDGWRRAFDAGNTGAFTDTVAGLVQKFESIFDARDRCRLAERLVDVPGWTAGFADQSLSTDTWELKEDLLQLRHAELNRTADLGWYRDRFTVTVFQGDFQGEMLAQRDARDQTAVMAVLRELLRDFSTE